MMLRKKEPNHSSNTSPWPDQEIFEQSGEPCQDGAWNSFGGPSIGDLEHGSRRAKSRLGSNMKDELRRARTPSELKAALCSSVAGDGMLSPFRRHISVTQREGRNVMSVDKTSVLKIDKDVVLFDSYWNREYLRLIVDTCRLYGVNVVSVKMCPSQRKGVHYYVALDRSIGANDANMLQYIFGDDAARVDHNRARIESGLNQWSKLFEKAGTRLRTIYGTHGERGAGH
jgi:hypothetical protein